MIKFQGKKRFHHTLSFVRASTLPVRIWWGSRRGRVDVSLLFYAFIMTIQVFVRWRRITNWSSSELQGDCPALSLMGNFINHNGYYSCWLCFHPRTAHEQQTAIPPWSDHVTYDRAILEIIRESWTHKRRMFSAILVHPWSQAFWTCHFHMPSF